MSHEIPTYHVYDGTDFRPAILESDHHRVVERTRVRSLVLGSIVGGLSLATGVLLAPRVDPNAVQDVRNSIETGSIDRPDLETVEVGDIPAERWQEMYDATLRLAVLSEPNAEGVADVSGCTATVLNNEVLVTAAHCLEAEDPIIKVTGYIGDTVQENAFVAVNAWALHPSKDIAVADISFMRRDTPEVNAPIIDGTHPVPGTHYYINSLPGDAIDPIPAELTLAHSNDNETWFIRDNDDPKSVCDPGASGALLSDGANRYALLTVVVNKDAVTPSDWLEWVESVESRSGFEIDENNVDGLCGAEVLSGNDITELLAEARKN